MLIKKLIVMVRSTTAIIATATFAFVGCEPSIGRAKSNNEVHFQYQLGSSEKASLLSKLSSVTLFESASEVKDILGPPTEDLKDMQKRGGKSNHFYEYYCARVSIDSVNSHDQVVTLFFNDRDLLTEIAYTSLTPVSGDVVSRVDKATGWNITYVRPPTKVDKEPPISRDN